MPGEPASVESIPTSDTRTLAPGEADEATAWLAPFGDDWSSGEYAFTQGYTV